jgi:K+-sensing histidine kinase KdpD
MPRLKTAPNGQIRLIKVLAHDLRNPISGILAASQCLIEDASTLLDDQQMTLLRSIESSSDLMLQLIEDMLEIVQAGSGKPKLRLRPTDVSRLVEQSTLVHQPLAEAKNIRLGVKQYGAIPPIDLDPVKMTQALNAVLTNAVRCAPPCGEIEIDLASRPRNVLITVRHITADDCPHYAQPAAPHRRTQEANTLTVSAIRLIVEGHGGAVRVEKGSIYPTFTLSLPRSRNGAKTAQARARHVSKARRSSAAG